MQSQQPQSDPCAGQRPRRVEAPLEEACFQTESESASCVQKFDDSLNSAIRTTYRISLRSSSLREPRYPSARVVFLYTITSKPVPETRQQTHGKCGHLHTSVMPASDRVGECDRQVVRKERTTKRSLRVKNKQSVPLNKQQTTCKPK